MNAHTPFDANQDWSNPYCQNKSNDPMVDALLGNAYHVVRTVYCNLGYIKHLYDFLSKYGVVICVQSEAELKTLTTEAKYARIYDKSPAGDRRVTDYLYVDDDRTGILPDDTTATGSWVKVATSNSGVDSKDGGYIPWVYNSGSATGGETSIRIPDETAGAPFMIVNGDWQTEGYDFEYDPLTFEIKFTTPLEQGDFVVVMRTGVPATPDNPNVSDWVTINWLYNHGAAVGGEQVIDIPYTFQSVPAVYKNGLRFCKGLANNSYTIDSDNNRIILTEPLATNDRLVIQLGGEAKILETVDHTIQEVARAANVKDSEVILSTDTTQVLNGKKVIYDVVSQRIYGLPSLPTNIYINAVSDGQLTYSPGNITVTLLDSYQQQNTRELWRRSLAESGLTLVDGSFEEGATANNKTDAVWYIAGGQCYTWDSTFPKSVPADSTPESSGGINVGAWVSVGDAALRQELTAPGGAGLVGGVVTPVTWIGFSGGADPTGVAASDSAFAAANASGSSVFVPAGTYKISGNTDMSACELMFEKGATIDVQAGATLTVGRILCGLHQVFSGAGSVVFTTNTIKAYPEWFGAMRGIDSTPALTKCQAACSPNKITTSLVDEYLISDLVWDRRVPAEASPRAAFKPFGSAANGVKLTAGNSVGKNSFPAISGFPGYGMRIVGTSLANIYISEIQGCGDALVLETSESATTLLDTEVTLTSISACDNAVVFVADKLANVMQGNRVYVNFIANCTNSVLFRDNGLANPGPNWDSNQVITQAIDPTTSRTNAVMLKNECGYAINRFVFRVETWAGGLASTGKFISGRFNDLDAYINLSQNPVAGMFSYTGASNRVDFSSARGRNTTPVTAVNASNSMPSFNGGVPLFHNVVKLKYIPSVDWANNTQKQAYIYHQLTDQNTNAFTVQPPDSGSLRGTTVDSVIDNSLTVPYEIQINLRNVSGVTITAGTEIEFKLRVGLY